MATKKATAVKAAKGTSLVKWDEELAKFASASTATVSNIGSGGNWISLKGGKITYKGGEIPGNKMEVVVLAHILERDWYKEKYNPNSPTPPTCYGFGEGEDGIVAPHEDVTERQNEECADCQWNEWGSADTGRGKACREGVRMSVLSRSDLEEDIENAESAMMRIPVTSAKGWAGYVRNVSEVLNRPPFAVVTEITVVPDSDNQFKVLFKMVEPVEDGDVIGALIERHKKEAKAIYAPYPKVEAAPARSNGKKPAPAKKRKF